MQKLSAVVYKEENLYIAESPVLGVASQGSNIQEALDNLQEAVELYLEEVQSPVEDNVFMTTINVHLAKQHNA